VAIKLTTKTGESRVVISQTAAFVLPLSPSLR
jgi:hypothetical protein